jgi:hypothetical protein
MIDFKMKWMDCFHIGDEFSHLIRTMNSSMDIPRNWSITHCLVMAFSYETLNVQEMEKTIKTKLFPSYNGHNFIYDSFNIAF